LKYFTLDTKNDMIAGVCAGIAKYFEIDVVLVRVAFVFLTFFTGFTALLYIILAIVAPNDYDIERLTDKKPGPGNDNV